MAEVLVQFDEPQRSPNGVGYVAQVWGRRLAIGLWEAWIEFAPSDGSDPIRTPRETEQLTRGDLRYWAAGVTRTYLQGALQRALSRSSQDSMSSAPGVSAAAAPEPTPNAELTVLETTALSRPSAALDPFALYRQRGEYVLRQELRALTAHELGAIIAAYDIPEIDTVDMARTFEDALAERIVAGVQQVVGSEQARAPQPAAKTLDR